MRKVARQFGVTLRTVQKWVAHAGDHRLDRVDFANRPPGRREPINKTSKDCEDIILSVRRELKEQSALGEFGADAIHRELTRRRRRDIPSVRTIGRILDRRGALDGRKRTRRPAPPPGWYLPKLARRRAELDSFDIVEGLVIQGGYGVEVLNGISLHGALVASWPRAKIAAKTALNALVAHWREFGLPDYAQFDNDTVFQGPHAHPDTVGRVSRLCLSLGVTVVFAPPRETGFQAAIESYNGRWQAKVWNRFHFESRRQLLSQSNKYVTAVRRRAVARIDAAPPRRPFPEPWTLNLQDVLRGTLIYLRRTNDQGRATLLGRTFDVSSNWPHRLVRAEVQLQHGRIRFYALRRRDIQYQPLLNEAPYQLPKRPFKE